MIAQPGTGPWPCAKAGALRFFVERPPSGGRFHTHHNYIGLGAITIHVMPKRSVTMPNALAKNVSDIGIVT
ncbi:hypothetical protein R11007_03302 [Ralstonia holmesii]|nr:hypothetical protein R11007_03302 [Ralstonia sp. LMG 32967]